MKNRKMSLKRKLNKGISFGLSALLVFGTVSYGNYINVKATVLNITGDYEVVNNVIGNSVLDFDSADGLQLSMNGSGTDLGTFTGENGQSGANFDIVGQGGIVVVGSLIVDEITINQTVTVNEGSTLTASSIRNTSHVINCALCGGDIATVPFKVLKEMVKHSLTDKGLAQFDLAIEKTAQLSKK